MRTNLRQLNISHRLRSRSGQSLIIALSVMFIMVFIGTIFVTLVARNLNASVRSGNVLVARQMAEAGIQYADRMLTYGEEGADWRPEPDGLDPASNANHPDIRWLQPYEPAQSATGGPTGGFTSFSTEQGRFLLRVTYNPDPRDPSSRFIKIESVGREGFVDSNFQGSGTPDPTTYANTGPVRLRHELTAFKPIGITDYVRFVTNKEKRTEPASFGRSFGNRPLAFGGPVGGEDRTGPVRVNGDLLWRGPTDVYLRSGQTAQSAERLPVERVEVAGEIQHDPPDAPVRVFNNGVLEGTARPTRTGGSLNPDFTTFQGLYRDGADEADVAGYGRAVRRLEPPLVDQTDPSSGVARYRRLTENSGVLVTLDGGRSVNSGRYGYGRGLYIDNSRDTQQDGSTMFGGTSTLTTEWTTPNNRGSWRGDFYVPPGAVVRINPDETITITRTDSTRRGQTYVWYELDEANGDLIPRPAVGPTFTLPYPENGVIFAEGNIRVSGVVAPDRQLTVVSDEIIYIEGNIMKGDPDTSALALLARRYVVVNTTQFLSLPPMATPLWESTTGSGEAPFAYRITTSADSDFIGSFSMGWWYQVTGMQPPTAYPDWDGGPAHLFVKHASSGGTASINLFVNGSPIEFAPGAYNYLMASLPTQYGPSVFEGQVFPLDFAGSAPLNGTPGEQNFLRISLNQTALEQSRGDYLLQSIAVVPMDINIQALIYAQEGSFFVIPGPWFNPDPGDFPGNPDGRPAQIKHAAFPYHGEPLDIKITVDGAVAENFPAAPGMTDEWMRHWSNIPERYGSSDTSTAHPGEGLSYVYDSRMGFPVFGPAMTPIRTDPFGRPLPVTPRLPCSPDLIYVGRLSS